MISTRNLQIDKGILQTIEETIKKYSMVNREEEAIIALSGGKDSLFASLALRELGYKIMPVIIDMGYEKNWGNKIVDLFAPYNLKPFVIDTRDTTLNNRVLPNLTGQINEGLTYLDRYVPDSQSTPCTVCYNTKIVALSTYAKKHEIRKIVFGHHVDKTHQKDPFRPIQKGPLCHVKVITFAKAS